MNIKSILTIHNIWVEISTSDIIYFFAGMMKVRGSGTVSWERFATLQVLQCWVFVSTHWDSLKCETWNQRHNCLCSLDTQCLFVCFFLIKFGFIRPSVIYENKSTKKTGTVLFHWPVLDACFFYYHLKFGTNKNLWYLETRVSALFIADCVCLNWIKVWKPRIIRCAVCSKVLLLHFINLHVLLVS